ncbi:MAG: hydratase [Flintibacter sp.]|uniref:nitrilase-related carbon-nitrogen hydrolase n=1 Tax=Flintibacter sp. TaxID=1918624 RepID=UPI002D801A10|nr:nitrilase-related carbon-nitrogen hydrolase [Flintibacter sp.]MCI7159139.1 hydratase [Flintibacter sp.]
METIQSPAKIACIQMTVVQGEVEKNLATAKRMIEEACTNRAQILVLPEMFNTGCAFSERKVVFSLAEEIPGGKSSQLLLDLAKTHQVYIVGSLIEREGPDLYNTAILAGPDGLVGKYRKLHPCEEEVYWVEPGNLGLPVFHTPIGRIALLICLDAYYPETARICAMQGADIICIPSNWSDVKKARNLADPYCTMAPVLCMANALFNHALIAGTNCVGKMGDRVFPGQSVIANPWGAPIAGPASREEEIIYADVDLCDSRRKYFHPTNSRLANRRTDVYSADLGYDPKKYLQK